MPNPKMAHILVENDPIDKPKQMPPSKKFLLFRKLVKNAKWWSKSSLPNYPSLTLLTAKFFPLKMVLKNHDRACQRCDTFSTTYFIYEYYMVSNRPFQRPLCFRTSIVSLLVTCKSVIFDFTTRQSY